MGDAAINVIDLEADVVHAGASPFEEAGDAAVFAGWFNQLDLGLSGWQESYDRFLIRYVFNMGDVQSKAVAPEFQGGIDVLYDNGYVVDPAYRCHIFPRLIGMILSILHHVGGNFSLREAVLGGVRCHLITYC
jgi:hypothetical protein